MKILDANVLLRFILQDNVDQANFAEEQIQQNNFLIPIEVISEIVYVLSKAYDIDNKTIGQLINDILNLQNAIIPHKRVIELALQVYAQTKLDFVDCVLVGYAKMEGHKIISFDKKLNKYLVEYESANDVTK
jgi:predicted nucleic-acid-binding protein